MNLFKIILLVLGFTLCFPSLYGIGLMISFLLYLFLSKDILKRYGIFSLSFFSVIFFGLYGYSVPISVLLKSDIGEYRLSYISSWMSIDSSLISFSLMVHLALFASLIAYNSKVSKNDCYPNSQKWSEVKTRKIYYCAIYAGLISSLFELINFVRVGGVSVLLSGKLAYQSGLSDIGMLLPSELLFFISAILFALYLRESKGKKIRVFLLFIAFNMLYLVNNLIIGERGTIVIGFICFLLAFNSNKKISKINFKYVFFGLFFYLIFSVITVYRSIFDSGIKVSTNEAIEYVADNVEKFLFVLNPANTEFGTSCLNYRVFLTREKEVNYQFGLTYLHFYTQLLPRNINPFYDKSVTIKFRDKYFIERSYGGSIGGTGYSAIYEAFINFGYLGAFIIYFLYSHLLILFERKKLASESIFYLLVYVLMFELIMLFPRSSFEYVFLKYIPIIIVSSIVSYVLKLKFKD